MRISSSNGSQQTAASSWTRSEQAIHFRFFFHYFIFECSLYISLCSWFCLLSSVFAVRSHGFHANICLNSEWRRIHGVCIVVFHWNRERNSKTQNVYQFIVWFGMCVCACVRWLYLPHYRDTVVSVVIVVAYADTFTHGKIQWRLFSFARTWNQMKEEEEEIRIGRSVVLECVCVALNARKSNRGYKKQPPTESVVCFDASIVPAPVFSCCCRIGLLLELELDWCGCESVSPFVGTWYTYIASAANCVRTLFPHFHAMHNYIAEWHWCTRFVLFWLLSAATHKHIEHRQKQSHIARHKIRVNSNAVDVVAVADDINTE